MWGNPKLPLLVTIPQLFCHHSFAFQGWKVLTRIPTSSNLSVLEGQDLSFYKSLWCLAQYRDWIRGLNLNTEILIHPSAFSLLWYGILVEYMKRIWPHVDMYLGNPFQIIMSICLWYYIKGMVDLLKVQIFHGTIYKKKKKQTHKW